MEVVVLDAAIELLIVEVRKDRFPTTSETENFGVLARELFLGSREAGSTGFVITGAMAMVGVGIGAGVTLTANLF